MMRTLTPPAPVSLAAFHAMFESVKNWGRWGLDDRDVGRGAHCFEYSVVLSDVAGDRWLVEGINLMKLKRGLISSLRSFEDAPRRLGAD
jgi:hypothetical protein